MDCWDSYLESSHSSPIELGMIVMVCYTNKGPKAMNGGGKRRKVKKKKEEACLASVSLLLSSPTPFPSILSPLFRETRAEV